MVVDNKPSADRARRGIKMDNIIVISGAKGNVVSMESIIDALGAKGARILKVVSPASQKHRSIVLRHLMASTNQIRVFAMENVDSETLNWVRGLARDFPKADFIVTTADYPHVIHSMEAEGADLLERINDQAEKLDDLCRDVDEHIRAQYEAVKNNASPDDERARLSNSEAGRWRSIARTDLQTGLMALRRAVEQPTDF